MNYFAHARVASTRRTAPAFVLGAMLPDFAHMIGARVARVDHPELDEGCRLHHATDDAFHRAPRFRALLAEATERLLADGVGRGPARGAAHVGVELLFDGALLGDAEADAAYLAALDQAHELGERITWRRDDGPERWRRLHARLAEDAIPYALRDPAKVAARVARVLEPRRRLRLTPDERAKVEDWLSEARVEVAAASDTLLAETLSGLES